MSRLKNRQMQIPNGLKFYEPSTKWEPPPFQSFDIIVNTLIAHRKGNPHLIQKNGWTLDYENVANEVDAYNTRLCQQMGWTDYIMDGGPPAPPPSFIPPPPNRLESVAAGAKTVVEWLRNGAEAVPAELSVRRAAVCAECPKNVSGDWTSWFTVPVSEGIRAALNLRSQWNLSTPHDDKLNVCEVCLCPIKLKLHLPLADILAKMKPQTLAALPDWCWIKRNDAP